MIINLGQEIPNFLIPTYSTTVLYDKIKINKTQPVQCSLKGR